MDPSGGPGGYDPCECVWNHEMAMRRLINMLRSTQSYCTDSECVDEFPLQRPPANGDANYLGILLLWVVLAIALFMARPRRQAEPQKEIDNAQGNGGSSPPPPMAN